MFTTLIGKRVRLNDVALFVVLVARRHGKEELTLGIPELRLNTLFESGSLLAILGCLFFIAGKVSDASDRIGIGPHVGVEGRAIGAIAAQDVSCLSTVDIELHAIVVTRLPKHFHLRHPVSPLPRFVVFDQVG